MTEFLSDLDIEAAVTAVRQKTTQQPTIGLVLGSGLNQIADNIENPTIIPYEEIPNWPVSTVPGHSGRLVIGQFEGKTVIVQQGRAHYYEGHPLPKIVMPVRVMRRLGVTTLIVTNAAGGINPNFTAGDLMLIKDHLNMPGLAGNNPLRGPNDDTFGPRFPDMIEVYTPALRKLAHETAVSLNFKLQEGVYAFVGGPSFETPAELHFLRTVGADAVGMSTVPSVVVARHAGMHILGISSITNMAVPDPAPGTQLSHEEVMEAGKVIVPRLAALLRGIVRQL